MRGSPAKSEKDLSVQEGPFLDHAKEAGRSLIRDNE